MKSPRSNASPAPPEFDDPLLSGDAVDQRSLALLWLAESAPLSAAPAESLTNIRTRLNLAASPVMRHRRWRLAAIAGWAAAACLAALLWHRSSSRAVRPEDNRAPGVSQKQPAREPRADVSNINQTPAPETVQPLTDPAELRRQVAEMRAALNAASDTPPGTHRPVIKELRPPGSAAPPVSQDRVLDIIATALEGDLRRRSAAGDARELIIESGWANWSAGLPADTVFRHRQFPKGRWAELGLLQGPNGQFLDPATNWVWTPDPDSSDYTGRAAPAGLDRTVFAGGADRDLRPPAATAAVPAGYLLQGSSGQAIIALNNLPAIGDGDSISLTSFSANGMRMNYGLPIPATATTEGWGFSGIIPDSYVADLTGFSVEVHTAGGGGSIILSTGGPK